MSATRPLQTEYAPHYHTYITKVPSNNLLEALKDSQQQVVSLLQSIPENKHNYRYAPGKWTIKEVLGHLIDAERVFAYRALVFARNDKNQLPGFDENDYAPQSNANNRTMQHLLEEYQHVRNGNILMFAGFTDEMFLRKGIASTKEISVRALGFTISGHELHHLGVLKERYL